MPVLQKGSSGPQVLDLQKRLQELGFDPTGVDGDFGPGTEAAVIAFQKAHGLEADGKVGPNTSAALQLNGDAAGGGGSMPDVETVDANGFSKTLKENDYKQAAQLINCEVAAIKAVAEVESSGGGFLPDGRPKILFERHKFHAFTNGAFDATHPDISNKSAGGYGNGGTHQWDRFNEAFALNPVAAIKSCSWGKFQTMGFNFQICGFATLDDFHTAMLKSEGEHLTAFCNFISGNNLGGALRSHNWAAFAAGYNGADFRINDYDGKLRRAFERHSKQ